MNKHELTKELQTHIKLLDINNDPVAVTAIRLQHIDELMARLKFINKEIRSVMKV